MYKYIFSTVLLFSFIISSALTGQTKWKFNENKPVLSPGTAGTWDDVSVSTPYVIKNWNGLHMFYTGFDGTNYGIGYAYSTDGINWVKHMEPVLLPGGGNGWDSTFVRKPVVIFNNNIFKMWYAGAENSQKPHIGYAISQNGKTWIKSESNPILYHNSAGWERAGIWPGFVLKSDSTFLLWYSGYSGIGFAKSPNELSWLKYENNAVIVPSGISVAWDGSSRKNPSIVYLNSTYQLWFDGIGYTGHRIGYATSSNGFDWDIRRNPVLAPSVDLDSSYAEPSIVFDGQKYHMWFSVFRYTQPPKYIYYATSQNLASNVPENKPIPTKIVLKQNYPNPFNPSTAIQFAISEQTYVKLAVFNSAGEKTATLISTELAAGEHAINWQPEVIPSGIYFYKLVAGNSSISKKMLFLK